MERIEELTYKAQQRQRQGRTLEAIRLFEQALERRIILHGPESSSVRKACDSLSDVLNGAALKHLQNEEYEEARSLLQKAEMLTGPDDLSSAVTYNNIACYYRRKNKLRTALKYLEKAQRIEMKSRVVSNPAGTRLNLCAVLSQLERHHDALEHAHAAVVLLQEELAQMELNDEFQERSPETLNKMAVLAISYHNIGVEEEYLKRHAASLAAYKKGVQIARSYLGPETDITRTLIKSCQAAQEHLDATRVKKGLFPPDIMRQGETIGGAYEALQQHHSSKRRAQSAGSQRSQSTTPSWAIEDRSFARPSTAHIGSRSLSRTSAWVDDDRNAGNTSSVSAGSEKGPLRSDQHDRTKRAPDRNGHPEDFKEAPASHGIYGRQRPASALGSSESHASGSSTSQRESEPLNSSAGAKRGPKTPRLNADQRVPAIRRPPSASLRQPVLANLSNGGGASLAKQLKRVDEEKEKKHNYKSSYAWEEEMNGLDIKDVAHDLVDHCIHDQLPSNRRVTYERPVGQSNMSNILPSDESAPRGGERNYIEGIRSESGGIGGGSSHGKKMYSNCNSLGIQSGPLEDDDLLDEYDDAEVDVDSGTEDIIQDRQIRGNKMREDTRPASASVSRPSEGLGRELPATRSSVRPASASIAVIQQRRHQDRAERPSSAAPSRTVSDSHNNYRVTRAGSHDSQAVGKALDYPLREKRTPLRPASASVARPASASLPRPGSVRPATSNIHARPASASVARSLTRDPLQDDIARASQHEEREILDILSDNSEYESDLELEAEAMALLGNGRHAAPMNLTQSNVAAMQRGQPQRLRELHRPALGEVALDAKRAKALAKTEIGLDHSDYESEDAADVGGGAIDARESRIRDAQGYSRDKYPALEQINTLISDGQYEERKVIGQQARSAQRPQRPSDSGRPQRPSNTVRHERPSDRSSAPSRSSRPPDTHTGRRDLHKAVALSDHSEYESDDKGDHGRRHLDDMSGTLKWLEDGLTARRD